MLNIWPIQMYDAVALTSICLFAKGRVLAPKLGTLSKPRRQRQRQRRHRKTKDLIGRTIAQHLRFKTLYIS